MADVVDSLTSELEALYAETDALLSGWTCAASGTCCSFSITRRQPELWAIEWRLLEKELRARPPAKSSQSSGDCPAFDTLGRRCRAYDARPFGCRTYFCGNASAPSKNPRREIRDLARRLAELAARHDSRAELRPLLTWHAMPASGRARAR